MHAGTKFTLVCINFLILCLAESYGHFESIRKTRFDRERRRATRQTGYVYDRPAVSFNLPSRATPVASSTQASPVDRTVMQMYYAYPVPAGGTALNVGTNAVSAGYSSGPQNSGVTYEGNVRSSSATAESGGYNYGAPSDVKRNGQGAVSQTNQQVPSVIASGGASSSGGYNYGSQATSRESSAGGSAQNNNQVTIASGASTSEGYNYRAPSTIGSVNPQVDSVTNVVSNTNSGTSGYNYNVQANVVGVSGDDSSSLTISGDTGSGVNSDSTGYNYKKQNTAVSLIGSQANNAISADRSTVIDSTLTSLGYNYKVPKENSEIFKTSPISETSPVQSTTATPVSVSTNAPEYLPPISNVNNVNVLSNNNNFNSGAGGNVQSDVYLPPSITTTTPKLVVQQTTDIQPVNNISPSDSYLPPLAPNVSVTQTSSETKPAAGSDVYLPPASLDPSRGIQTISTTTKFSQVSNTSKSDLNLLLSPKNTYLRPSLPSVSSNTKTLSTLSNLPVVSSNYLPPIATSIEINQLVSTPAATYLPPVL